MLKEEISKKTNYNITDIFLFLFLLALTGFFKQEIFEYIFLFLFILSVLIKVPKSNKLTFNLFLISYALFAIWAGNSYFWAYNAKLVLSKEVTIIALTAFLATLTNYIHTKDDLLRVMKITVFSNIMVALKILVLYHFSVGTAANRFIQITGVHFNTVGQVLGFSILFSIYLYKLFSNKKYLIGIIPQIIVIILSESRKSLLIPVLGIMFLIVFNIKNLKKYIFHTIVLLLVTLGAGLIIYNINSGIILNIESKFIELFKYALGQSTTDWSINLRQFFIQTGIEMFKSRPLIGYGLDNFSFYVSNYTSYGISRYAHNNYVEMLSCLGIIGFALYYFIYVYILIKLFKILIKKKFHYIIAIPFVIFIILIIMEWGIVTYSGGMYHIFLLIFYYVVLYNEELIQN